jgi:dethiobiotin synthetase
MSASKRSSMPMRGLFITGTDTGVGKTVVACAILRAALREGVSAGGYKPVCSGAEHHPDGRPYWQDVEDLHAALNAQHPRELICPQTFAAPLAPPVAAEIEGKTVDWAAAIAGADRWRERVDLLIVEGAGGLLAPVTDRQTAADFAVALGFPLVVVSANRLGVVNHTLLTLAAARERGLTVAAVVLNHISEVDDLSAASNFDLLRKFWNDEPLLSLAWGSTVVFARGAAWGGLDWWQVAAESRSQPA